MQNHGIWFLFFLFVNIHLGICEQIHGEMDNNVLSFKLIDTTIGKSVMNKASNTNNTNNVSKAEEESILEKIIPKNFDKRMLDETWVDLAEDARHYAFWGIIFFTITCPLVVIYEGILAHRKKAIYTVKKHIKNHKKKKYNIQRGDIEDPNKKQLIHERGELKWSENEIIDREFNFKIKKKAYLKRKVEMYQYIEKSISEKRYSWKNGFWVSMKDFFAGRKQQTKKTYSVVEQWSEKQCRQTLPNMNLTNPPFPPFISDLWFDHELKLTSLEPEIINSSGGCCNASDSKFDCELSNSQKKKLVKILKEKKKEEIIPLGDQEIVEPADYDFEKKNNYYYYGRGNDQVPMLGDIRISWYTAKLDRDCEECLRKFTVVCGKEEKRYASYTMGSIAEYKLPYLYSGWVHVQLKRVIDQFNPTSVWQNEIDLFEQGIHSAKKMFSLADKSMWYVKYILRLVGFLLLRRGIHLLLQSILILSDVYHNTGTSANLNIGIIAFILALPIYSLILAYAYLPYQPMVSIFLILIWIGIFVGIGALSM